MKPDPDNPCYTSRDGTDLQGKPHIKNNNVQADKKQVNLNRILFKNIPDAGQSGIKTRQ